MDTKYQEEWIKVYESSIPNFNSKGWLEELLEEKGIPYRGDIEQGWTGIGKYSKYYEKYVIYVPLKFKLEIERYIKEFNDEENILTEGIEELQTNEDTEEESKKFAQKQKLMQRVLIGIVIAMVVSIMIASLLAE